uniref:Uncharacterized protein n=1 Tax=Mola mola TaxID=94237 RepID=A0A3Q4BA30_MOLML
LHGVLIQADQECLFTLMSNSQRGRMDEQRCSLNVSPASTPKHKPNQILASSQSRRLDDQRVSLPSLPGIKNGSTSSTSTATEKDASYLCYMVSKVQVGSIHNVRLKGHAEKLLTVLVFFSLKFFYIFL